jgi:hypothetical protein
VLPDLEANDAKIDLGEGFITPFVTYQLSLEDGWWCAPYS